MTEFRDWKSAHTAAVHLARQVNRDVGIWGGPDSLGLGPQHTVFVIATLPKPEHRCGHELRCEVVTPIDPLSTTMTRSFGATLPI